MADLVAVDLVAVDFTAVDLAVVDLAVVVFAAAGPVTAGFTAGVFAAVDRGVAGFAAVVRARGVDDFVAGALAEPAALFEPEVVRFAGALELGPSQVLNPRVNRIKTGWALLGKYHETTTTADDPAERPESTVSMHRGAQRCVQT